MCTRDPGGQPFHKCPGIRNALKAVYKAPKMFTPPSPTPGTLLVVLQDWWVREDKVVNLSTNNPQSKSPEILPSKVTGKIKL